MDAMPQDEGNGLITIFYFLLISRWIHFASVFVLFGGSLFWFYMGKERMSGGPGGLPEALRATTLMLRIAAPIAALSGVAWLASILANATSDFGNVVDPETLRLFFLETEFGPVSVFRLILLAGAVVITVLPVQSRAWFLALSQISALLLISQAWLGHAAEGGAGLYAAAMIIAYSVHILATAAWVGGLPPLLFTLYGQHHVSPKDARDWSLDILSRYSLMGMIAVTLIVISGSLNAGFRVAGSFGKLFYTGYGNALFTKISFVALMLALAFFNRFIAMPRLRSAALNGMAQIIWLRRSVALEMGLGLLALSAAAVLGITPPPQ